jgi:hypothetical protein
VAETTDTTEIVESDEAALATEPQMSPGRPFFYSLAELPSRTIAEMAEDGGASAEDRDKMFDLFGRDLLTTTILVSPELSVFHEVANPGERVKPHRHGTHQLTYVLKGSLIYGNRVTSAGMGYYSPDRLYAWRAGDEGAEWIEIHAGLPGTFTDSGR